MKTLAKRLPAEWEKADAIQITWPHDHSIWEEEFEHVTAWFQNFAHLISERGNLILVCQNRDVVKTKLKSCNWKNIILIESKTNDIWARDHGGITIFENSNPVVLDYTFNGWGLKFSANFDNQISKNIANSGFFKPGIHRKINLVLEGGAIDSDGLGTILTTSNCLLSNNRNEHLSKEEIEAKLKEDFGAKKIHWVDYGFLEGDDTDSHIDMLARFTDENTIVYTSCSDKNDIHYAELKKMEDQLKTFLTSKGKPYKLYPLYLGRCLGKKGNRMPSSYTNFLIFNQTVFVPQYGLEEDKPALETLKICFPEKEVLGINCRALITQGGSLHCATMQYPVGVLK
ncbi:agmatine deiminase family protein [Flexithrix dorotheae]|uniref:agmatine deiminase family protein n=1 Tax=Flexithrix dorotheae TaxID=70993 RepID=UPI00035D55EE|nr:agmatine deiminase family protein [Flexithrix dorotheae]